MPWSPLASPPSSGRRPSTRPGSISPRAWGRRWARPSRARGSSSRKRGAASSRWAGPCARRGSLPRGVYALRHHVKRLADDHVNAKRLAEGLATLPGVSLDPATVETNIVFFDLTGSIGAPAAVERLLSRGVRMGALGPRTIRAVTHLDVSAQGIERSLEAAQEVFTG